MGLLSFEWINGQQRLPGATPLLEVQGVSVRLGQRLVLDDVSLELHEGEQVRVTGPNGAGKSTLLNAIMGLAPLCQGRVIFRGEDISNLPTHERARCGIVYMRQRANVFPALTVYENLKLAVGQDGYERFAERFPEWATDIRPDIQAGMLSGGQKQKLAWAMTVQGGCNLILADESEAGMSEQIAYPENLSCLQVTHT